MRTFVFCFVVAVVSGVENDEFNQGVNEFAAKLYQQITNKTTTSHNFLINPLAIHTLLALSASHTSEQTAQEIYNTIAVSPSDGGLEHWFENVTRQFQYGGDFYTLNSTNAMVYDKNLMVLPDFERHAKEVFGVTLLRDIAAVDDGALVLNSELIFSGLWSRRFEKRSIYKSRFFVSADETIEIETMHSTGNYYYYEDKELKADFVEIPFKGKDVFLTLVLPNKTSSLEQLEARISDVLAERKYEVTYMNIALPKFSLQHEFDVTEHLRELGLTRIFDGNQAHFSNMFDNNQIPLRVGGVYQKTSVEIDEKGGRGAAVRSVFYPKVTGTQKRARTFIVDRPFLFFLKKNDLLFLVGKITKPEFKLTV